MINATAAINIPRVIAGLPGGKHSTSGGIRGKVEVNGLLEGC
jgi:hypothetical protein